MFDVNLFKAGYLFMGKINKSIAITSIVVALILVLVTVSLLAMNGVDSKEPTIEPTDSALQTEKIDPEEAINTFFLIHDLRE